ncbi:WD40-repeat-containing domain protein [Amylocystis lapponica]|nr:WD40-repeat-containing domain protein [Amylocystis lapponica]
MDVRHSHGTDVYVVRTCYHDDGADLVAIGGAHSVEVLQTTPTSCKTIANFHIGTRITALAWSSRAASSSTTDEWSIELAAAGADFGLYLLSISSAASENVGHHGKVNDMAFCGGQSEDSSRYVATVSDDKMLVVWDLDPPVNIASPSSPHLEGHPAAAGRPQPTALVIPFPHPLSTVDSHPSTSKEFLVSDCRGSIFLIDWRSDPDENELDSWRNSSVLELVEPKALADSVAGLTTLWSGYVSWQRDSADLVGATYGSKFAIWDMANLHGGKPTVAGTSFPEGGHQFRWCPSYPEYFAISTSSPAKGAVIHVHNTNFIHAQPTVFPVASRPQYVRSFDFLAGRGIPRIAAGVGREVVIFYIGVDS